ncbi:MULTISPECIES: RNA polymerase sigma factor [Lacrimispora]|jgi:RNA polymerase sigma-70 factor (ECF subfamily)|uniref:RNA polymerase sigma-70 factor (ECF subfamily) n=2 Tax=Lacrimispora TaxID=2719231 RepID=A0A2S6HCF6_9FIRM|nr:MULTISPECIES: RNA polymerase sigma factor [Clostridia]MBE5977478.1 RNA polymerase sigma factor [Paenibacillaceae bacterium]MTK09858.1 RNA polymerase sigma factor [Hungatella sp.]MBE5978193.1 RNA polymerase sigma factor [Paenibacillaceae bacterium]MBE5985494.1 RNA polymerase sigma factor [Paenibacillaceae bacterium]MBE5988671.1 RNA polymerase sigma factor [Paenibacillaceae bacterium]
MLFMGLMSFGGAEDYSLLSDEALLKKVAEGDQEAFQRLYQNTDRTMYSFILSIIKHPQDAEEILQEVYLKIWTSAKSYKSQGKPLAWMFTIARNLCYMKFREQKHDSDITLEDLSGTETGEVCSEIEMAADKMVLLAALSILKEEEREIVLLHTSAGMKHREIAASLKIPLATALSRYNRAMKKLENYLREE